MTELESLVLDLLDDAPGTIDELTLSTKAHRNTVRNAMRRLEDQGLVEPLAKVSAGEKGGRPPTVYGPAKTKRA